MKRRRSRITRLSSDRASRRVAVEMRRLASLGNTEIDLPDAAMPIVGKLRNKGGYHPHQAPANEVLVAADDLLERDPSVLKKFLGVPRRLRKASGAKGRRIAVSFSRTIPGGEDEYPESETGWINEEGDRIALDGYDRSEGVTLAQKAAKWLRDEGASQTSSSHFQRGTWYLGEHDEDYTTGASEQRSFHLYGFSPAEERAVFNEFTEKRSRS